jgi:hypothetical protein
MDPPTPAGPLARVPRAPDRAIELLMTLRPSTPHARSYRTAKTSLRVKVVEEISPLEVTLLIFSWASLMGIVHYPGELGFGYPVYYGSQ